MIKENHTDHTEEHFEEFEQTLTKTESFLETNSKKLTILFAAIIGVAVAIFCYINYYQEPRETEAAKEMFVAISNFEKDSFQLSLDGNDNYLGMLDIIDTYSGTPQANKAYYYAGISYLHLGEYETAIEYLSSFSTTDPLLDPIAKGAQGDAYSQLDNKEKAIESYVSAANTFENILTTPLYLMKAGTLYELQGESAKALEIYKRIKKDYKLSREGLNIDKYIVKLTK